MPNVLVTQPLLRRPQLILYTFLLALLATIPLWTNKIYYVDDYYRLFTGNSLNWISNGRPLTTFLNLLMHFSLVSLDISPLPLLLGLLIVSCASVIYCEKLSLPLKGYWQCVPPLFILFNPFLAQSMMFTFDSLSILISTALAMTASLSFGRVRFASLFLTVVLILSVFTTYQIGINIYCGCVVLLVTTLWLKGKPVGPYLLEKLGCLITALLIYKFLIVTFTVADNYSLSHSEILTLSKDAVVNVINNVHLLYSTFITAFPGYRIIFVVAPLILSYAGLWVLKQRHSSHTNKSFVTSVMNVVVIVTFPIMMVLVVPGLSTILTNPIYNPRVLSAWGCVNLFCFCVTIMAYPALSRWISGLFLISLFYCLIVMLTMFNAVVNEQQHMLRIAQHMKIDLALLSPSQVQHITMIEQPNVSLEVKTATGALPIVARLKSNIEEDNNSWFFELIIILENAMIQPRINATPEMKAYKPQQYISQSCDYRLFLYEGTAVFDFRNLHSVLKCK